MHHAPPHQIALPVPVTPAELLRKRSLGDAIELCAELADLTPKQLAADLSHDKGQWSRWSSGQEGVLWPKLAALMDRCGNDAPLLWMVLQRGYDLASLRRRESDLERHVRELREENAALRRVLQGAGR